MNEVNWSTIKEAYEAGASQTSLARLHGISQQAISKRALKEGWVVGPVVMPPEMVVSDNLVDQALADLANYLTGDPAQAKLALKDHKLFSDAFSAYMKAKLLTPAEQGYSTDMRDFLADCTDEELSIIRPVIAAVQARNATQKITPFRKQGQG